MPWNQSGGSGGSGPGGSGGQDPWGGGQSGGGRQAPPDLDELIRSAKRRLSALLGVKSGGGGGSGGGGPASGLFKGRSLMLVAVIALVIFGALGFYTVVEGNKGVELRFGKYYRTTGAGWHWKVPFVDEAILVDVQTINNVFVGYREIARTGQKQSVPDEALMLTEDENIIDIQFAVQYDIKDPRNLLFNVTENPGIVVRQATESAVREIVGRTSMDFALTTGRNQVAGEAKFLLQEILDRYDTGINIRAVEAQDAQPPAEVKGAFDDAVKAREDQQREINKAEAYSNDVLPRARGYAIRITQEAEAYRSEVVARAEGETQRFRQVLKEYQHAPQVTRDRLYIEAMESMLSKSGKLLLDQEGGNNILYLPIDQLIRRQESIGNTRSDGRSEESRVSGVADGAGSSDRNGGRTGRSLLP